MKDMIFFNEEWNKEESNNEEDNDSKGTSI